MMNQAQWAGVKVGDFFRGYNWQGSAPVLESSVSEASMDALPSQMCWSVADFFAQGNWSGQWAAPVTAPSSPPMQTEVPPQELSITASVLAFCRGINWQGQGLSAPVKVAGPSNGQVSPKEPVAKVAPSMGLEDLSDLF